MTTELERQDDGGAGEPQSTLERFLQAVEKKTDNQNYHRLLKVCRQANPSGALEAELRTIVSELINET